MEEAVQTQMMYIASFKAIRDELKEMLQTTSVQDLAKELHHGMAFLKR